MNKINSKIQETISKKVLEGAVDKEPSGDLSASRLGWPLQWQMLWFYKVPQKPIDEYTLRKFQRGKDVEDRIVDWIAPNPDNVQVIVNYRGVKGVVDLIDEVPIEVKSVTNMAFKHIQKEGVKRGHRLQGELYAKALGYDKFIVAYVASDDYRVLAFEVPVGKEVDEVITAFETQRATGIVPVFVAKEPWHAMKDYNPYPEWQKLTEKEIKEKLAKLTK